MFPQGCLVHLHKSLYNSTKYIVLQNEMLAFRITSETWNSSHNNMKTFN